MGLAGLPDERYTQFSERKIKGKMGRKAVIVNLGFAASLGTGGLCMGSRNRRWVQRGEQASATAPAAPVGHGGLCWKKGNPANLVLSHLSQTGQARPRGCGSGAALVTGEHRKERTENTGPIQNVPQHLLRGGGGQLGQIQAVFTRENGPKMEVVSSGSESEEPPAPLSPQTSAKAIKLNKLSH